MKHKIAEPVLTYPCYGIYADYDANAPDSETLFLVATQELADEVCQFLNKDPSKWGNLAFVDGYEWCKSFDSTKEYTRNKDEIQTDFDEVCSYVKGDTDNEDDDEGPVEE